MDQNGRQTLIITFTRALYAGTVAQGRTRILAAPQVDLCRPHIDYRIALERGSAQHARNVDELHKMNTLVHLFAPEEVGLPDGDGKEVPATIKPQ